MHVKPNAELSIVPFTLEWQQSARDLILGGLEEHWGTLDLNMNSDLSDIASSYADGHFLVALLNGKLVGTGAIVPEGDGVMRVMRMSVASGLRRHGIGTVILQVLLDHARRHGAGQIVCETTETWSDAIRFYLKHGFLVTGRQSREVHFALDVGRSDSGRVRRARERGRAGPGGGTHEIRREG